MLLKKNQSEIKRLITAFEKEANSFPDITFKTFLISDGVPTPNDKFAEFNHGIMLWQYYGELGKEGSIDSFLKNLQESDSQWGIRGAQHSLFGVIEGETTPIFIRMAKRAGNLFNKSEAASIQSKILNELFESGKSAGGKPTGVLNNNPLSIWLNYLLYHLSQNYPGREQLKKIEPDPYSLSLIALESILETRTVGKIDKSTSPIDQQRFRVAMSFPGEKRSYVSRVVQNLRKELGPDKVFYDYDYQAQLARPNLDTLLQSIYRSRSDLLVVFLCKEYADKEWCCLEWRAIRDIIKSRADNQIMFVRFDNAAVEGVFSIDGYIDGNIFKESEVADFITQRLGSLPELTEDK